MGFFAWTSVFGEPFVPTDIDGTVLWLRADMGITLNSGNVSAWADQSGNGNDAAQGTASYQPEYSTSADLADRPTLLYDDVDDHIAMTGLASVWDFLSDGSGGTLVCVVYPTGAGALLSTVNSGTATGVLLEQTSGAVRYALDDGVNEVTHQIGVGTGNAHVAVATWDGTMLLRVNGAVAPAVVESGDPSGTASIPLSIGSRNAFTLPIGGHVAEVVAYSRVLTADEIESIEAYATARYGL